MKKWIIAAALLAPLGAQAEMAKLGFWGGYTTLSPNDFSAAVEADAKSATTTVEQKNSGWIIGLDANIMASPFVMYGLRLEYLKVELDEFSTAGILYGSDATLVPVMAGLNVKVGFPNDFGLIAGVHGGWGFANVHSSLFGIGLIDASSGGFVGEVSAGFELGLAPTASLSIMGAYRYAPMKDFGVFLPDVDFSGINLVAGINIAL